MGEQETEVLDAIERAEGRRGEWQRIIVDYKRWLIDEYREICEDEINPDGQRQPETVVMRFLRRLQIETETLDLQLPRAWRRKG